MSKILGVSKSGYYKWQQSRQMKKENRDDLHNKVKSEFNKSFGTYGSPRITQELRKKEINISKSSTARMMKVLNLQARRKKKYKNTTDSKHGFKVPENLLNRNFIIDQINKVWVSDITYIRLNNSWMYLTIIMDLADRMIVGWNLSETMLTEDTTIAAFNKASKARNLKKEDLLMFHSDRGVQYACDQFTTLLKEFNCIQSMSRKGNCWDNAVAESFFKTLKTECIDQAIFNDSKAVYSLIFRYIEGWYNTKRIHTALNGKSPLEIFYEKVHILAA
jgi:putative transposase